MSGDHNMHCSANTKCTRCGKENPTEIHTCTPLALRLAEMLEGKRLIAVNVVEIAAELRRLYEVNAELVEALQHIKGVAMADEPRDLPGIAQAAEVALKKAKGESNAD